MIDLASPETADLRQRLADALRDNNPANPLTEKHLAAVLADTAGNPGRMIRPQLVWLGAVRNGLTPDEADQLASAIEYYHAASLLLDDLPCMDNATVRRGRACAHRTHGEASAILAALSLINRANALAQLAFATQPGAVRIRALAGLDCCLGPAGLTGGQARDLRFAESTRSAREVSAIALGKTGALLWLSICLPTLPAEPNPVEWRMLKALSVYWGLAYQAVDDLRDVMCGTAQTGKTANRDGTLHRPNLAHALGQPAAQRRFARLLRQAQGALARLQRENGKWDYLAAFHHTVFAGLAPEANRAASHLAA
ncbi:MAG: polyprenyl synthetase family protein [Opitutaceae bacterium]|nr:polyprenyl synthetase family protein [Opitutaceae bacterium]